MKKTVSSLMLIVVALQFFSCKEDEVPPAIISFSSQISTVSEGVGDAIIRINLSKAAPGDIIVNFTLVGSAQIDNDFKTSGSFTIPNGALEGELSISIIDDAVFEFDPEITNVFGESLEITLSGVSGNGILSDSSGELTHLLIIQENDPIARSITIGLSWDSGDGTPGDVDMDLILFYLDPTNGPIVLVAASSIGTDFEKIALGTPAPDGVYGLAFRYFEGSSNDLTFTSEFEVENGTLPGGGTTASFIGKYTQANVNGDVSQNATVQIVQTFEKKGLNYVAISDITIPDSGSRGSSLLGKVSRK
ncbi:MAG TPA: hypothetical protein DIS90_16150 [Cytophagales bacterium]|nr:hypothetical protein [Cytophagales bacterium]HCR54722.1 hypothetical protein [Cytophagales bacterium]